MSVVFISVPSHGNFSCTSMSPETWNTSHSLLALIARLHVDYPNTTFVVPSIQNYAILSFLPMNIDSDYDSWKVRCEALIDKCDEVWVLKTPGWSKSKGVAAEIEYAHSLNKNIIYIEA